MMMMMIMTYEKVWKT